MISTRLLIVYLSVFFGVLIWSGTEPADRFTWILEVAPAIIGLTIIAVTWNRFPLTHLAGVLVLIHSVILMVGGHYTYAEVPLFDWIRDVLGQDRNNYDKVGHLAQGFIPAILIREVLIRNRVVARHGWIGVITVTMCMAISAAYELIEWAAAAATGEAAEAFLGTQGYIWDTQSDMLYATIGAILALILLSRWHDHQLRMVQPGSPSVAD